MTSLLDELLDRYNKADKKQQKELGKLATSATSHMVAVPNPGPQTEAYRSKADILGYGGAAGGGKSFLSTLLALNEHDRSLILRREATQLDGLEGVARDLWPDKGAWNGQDHELKLGPGRSVKYGGMPEADSWRKYAGRPRDLIIFDEAAEFLEKQVQMMLAWNRPASEKNRRCRMVLPMNPPRGPEGAWVRRWFAPWLDPMFGNPAAFGEVRYAHIGDDVRWATGPDDVDEDGNAPLSITFIQAKLADNPFRDTPEYRKRLASLPDVEKRQLLHGDFLAGQEDHERQVIPTAWIEAANDRWRENKEPRGQMIVLGADVAQGGKDRTELAPLYSGAPGWRFDHLEGFPGSETQDGPSVAAKVVAKMRGRVTVAIDMGGGWGISARDHLRAANVLVEGIVPGAGSTARTIGGALGFKNVRAEMWWRMREALDPDNGDSVQLPPDPVLTAQLKAPTYKIVSDEILIESKDDIRKRLGSSTDRADAVIQAWVKRLKGIENAVPGANRMQVIANTRPPGAAMGRMQMQANTRR